MKEHLKCIYSKNGLRNGAKMSKYLPDLVERSVVVDATTGFFLNWVVWRWWVRFPDHGQATRKTLPV